MSRLLARAAAGLRALVRGRKDDDDLDEELRGFVAASIEDKVRAGVPGDRARREALVELGGLETVKEHVRDVGWETRLGTVAQDVRYGLRVLRRTPVVTAAAILSLALGMGANTAIFTLLDAVMLRWLPVERPEELRRVGMMSQPGAEPNPTFTNVLWEHIRDRQDVFATVFAWGEERMDLAVGGEAQHAGVLVASGSYFDGLGVRAAAGRLISAADDSRGCAGVAVLSHSFWQDRYGGDPAVVGRSISLDRHSFPIVGVVQAGFTGLNVGWKFDVAIPICAAAAFDPPPTRLDHRSWWWLNMMGRLKPGVTTEQANARLAAISSVVMAATVPPNWKPDMQKRFRARTLVSAPAGTGLSGVRRRYAEPLQMLLWIAGLVLVIACANIAALMRARASARRKEFAVRLAIGASRGRLIRQLLTESVLLSAVGAVAGLVLARWGSGALVRAISARGSEIFLDLAPDLRVLGFTALVSVATGLLFGFWPAIRATRTNPGAEMKGPAPQIRERRFAGGYAIAAGQVALCLALVVVSGLFLRSFRNLTTVSLGFDRGGLLIASAASRAAESSPNHDATFSQIEARLAALPGVTSVSRSILSPIGPAQWDNELIVEGPHPATADTDAMLNYVSPTFFRTLRMSMLAGREFVPADGAGAAPVAIVNETLARKFFGQDRPIGRRLHLDTRPGETATSIEVVGIAADSRYNSLRGDFPPTAFFPIAQLAEGHSSADFQVRVNSGDPMSMTRAVEREAVSVERELSLEFRTMDEQLDGAVIQERLLAGLSTFFGALALLLASVGLYGAVAFAVSRRQKETGIRLALGAAPQRVVWTVLGEVSIVVGAGVAAGLALAVGTARFTSAFLFNLAPTDRLTMVAAASALVLAGLAAGFVPARRAARTDPLASLRNE